MADLEQGIRYTIEADAGKAKKSLQDVGRQAAENGQRIEKAMAGANAVTSALSGNFVGAVSSLARMTRAVSGLGRALAAATGWIAIVGAVVAAFRKWRDSIAEAKEKVEQFKQARFDRHIAAMKTAQETLTGEIEKTVAAIDRQLDADTRSLDIIREKTKAQIELNRQMALEGRSDEEKERINAEAGALLARTDRDAAAARLAAQIAAQGSKTETLRKMLERQQRQSESGQLAYSSAVGDYQRIEGEELDKLIGERTYDDRKRLEALKAQKLTQFGVSEEAMKKEIADLERKLAADTADYRRRLPNSQAFHERLGGNESWKSAKRRADELGNLNAINLSAIDKLRTAVSDSELKESELAAQREIDEVKEEAAIRAEWNVQSELGKVRLDAGKRQAKELADAQRGYMAANERQKNAEQWLAAAQSAVQRAWGWYRDKDSMKAQLEEEKANAEAERQYERDFERLKGFRRDWRTAKNLSVDEEATRRVAIAREEEAAARKAVAETAENTARAATAVEEIQALIENGGEE